MLSTVCVHTCRIRSPSLIRPFFAAMPLGFTYSVEDPHEKRSWNEWLTKWSLVKDELPVLHLPNVDALVLVLVRPVADGQAQLLLLAGLVELHLLETRR